MGFLFDFFLVLVVRLFVLIGFVSFVLCILVQSKRHNKCMKEGQGVIN
jgi:hypothetical protein